MLKLPKSLYMAIRYICTDAEEIAKSLIIH